MCLNLFWRCHDGNLNNKMIASDKQEVVQIYTHSHDSMENMMYMIDSLRQTTACIRLACWCVQSAVSVHVRRLPSSRSSAPPPRSEPAGRPRQPSPHPASYWSCSSSPAHRSSSTRPLWEGRESRQREKVTIKFITGEKIQLKYTICLSKTVWVAVLYRDILGPDLKPNSNDSKPQKTK